MSGLLWHGKSRERTLRSQHKHPKDAPGRELQASANRRGPGRLTESFGKHPSGYRHSGLTLPPHPDALNPSPGLTGRPVRERHAQGVPGHRHLPTPLTRPGPTFHGEEPALGRRGSGRQLQSCLRGSLYPRACRSEEKWVFERIPFRIGPHGIKPLPSPTTVWHRAGRWGGGALGRQAHETCPGSHRDAPVVQGTGASRAVQGSGRPSPSSVRPKAVVEPTRVPCGRPRAPADTRAGRAGPSDLGLVLVCWLRAGAALCTSHQSAGCRCHSRLADPGSQKSARSQAGNRRCSHC